MLAPQRSGAGNHAIARTLKAGAYPFVPDGQLPGPPTLATIPPGTEEIVIEGLLNTDLVFRTRREWKADVLMRAGGSR